MDKKAYALIGWLMIFAVLLGGCASEPRSGPTREDIPWSDVGLSLELIQQDKDGFPQAFRVTFENNCARSGVLRLPRPLAGKIEAPEALEWGFIGFSLKSADGRENDFEYTEINATKAGPPEVVVLAAGERIQRVYKIGDLYSWRPEALVEGGRLAAHIGPGQQELQVRATLAFWPPGDESGEPKLESVQSETVIMRCRFDDKTFPPKEPEAPTTPLHQAVLHGNAEAVKRLLAEGADVNAKDDFDRTPLVLAAEKGDAKIAEALLAEGASVEAQDKAGNTALQIAALYGEVAVMKLLIARGAKVGAQNRVSWVTPLHSAALEGQVGAVELLLAAGANPNVKSDLGDTPLHFATVRGHGQVVSLLLDRGADVNARGNNGSTPLHQAAAIGNPSVAKVLLDRAAEVDARDNNGTTPLHLAAEDNYETPIWLQARDGYLRVVELLLARGADINARDKKGNTPLALAKKSGRRGTVNLLKRRGAKE